LATWLLGSIFTMTPEELRERFILVTWDRICPLPEGLAT